MTLSPTIERFILRWGDMGTHWGVNRSVSQIHALLYLSDRPMTAEEVAASLDIARSNVSTSLKELIGWNLVRRVSIRGDRRDYFEAESDIWEVFLRIAAGRKEREIDPIISALRGCHQDAARDPTVHPVSRERLGAMLEFTEMMDAWYSQMLSLPRNKLAGLVRLGARIASFLPGKKK